ncbi:MAG: type II toxin-antitoxin system VapC family toxin [Gemmataceae bacterium]
MDTILLGLWHYPIQIDTQTGPRAWTDSLRLARTYRLKVVEAAYLELAQRLALPLATISPKLRRAATAAGVPIFAP